MKKTLFTLLLMTFSLTAFAQKDYLVLNAWYGSSYGEAILSGAIPSGLKTNYIGADFGKEGPNSIATWIGNLLNLLAKEGFTVEQLCSRDTSNMTYLLSKPKNTPSSAIQSVKADESSDVYEMARYNLQGIPVTASEKGLQIIVYSNYTTKTVFVE